MYDFELQGLLSVAANNRSQYKREELAGMSQIIDAIRKLNVAVARLVKSEQVRLDANGQLVKVWHIEGVAIRDKQVYVDKRSVYLQSDKGGIQPFSPKNYTRISIDNEGLTPEELTVIAEHM